MVILADDWVTSELIALQEKYHNYGNDREVLKEAFHLCVNMRIYPFPEWVINGLAQVISPPSPDGQLEQLKEVFDAGNLGALKDAVYWCNAYKQTLPEWAVIGLYGALNALALGDQPILKKWQRWFKQYRQNIFDYEVLDTIKEAREHYTEWKDIFEITAAIISNKTEEEGGANAYTVESAYRRAIKGLKNNPYHYFLLKTFSKPNKNQIYNENLWAWIKQTVKSGKPKGIKNPRL